MTALRTDLRLGEQSRNRLDETTQPARDGAHAALESFYYALNQSDSDTLAAVWSADALAQLNNPLGGILRGGDSIVDLYRRIFAGPARLAIEFHDVIEYLGDDHAVFAGRESGTYTVADHEPTPIEIRTTRYFRFDQGRWRQVHHHGSIDDANALAAYQAALLGSSHASA